MFIYGVLINCIFGQLIVEIQDSSAHYKIHSDVSTTVLTLPQAWDGILQGKGCELKQKQIASQVELQQLIQINEEDFDARSLTHLSHDDNTIVVMTSDYKLIVIPKNNFESQSEYDLSQNIEEVHQIIVNDNIVLIITDNGAFIIYLSPFAIVEFKQWKQRQERWLSSIEGQFIFTAVGLDGLDLYHVDNLTFYRNINAVDLGIKQLCVRDYSLLNKTLHLLDCSRGLMIIKMDIYQNSIDFSLKHIDIQEGGIAVDTKNGVNVFVGYKWRLRYAIVEYIIEGDDWRIQNLVYSNRIKDVDANQQYALVQGNGRHMIAFNYGTKLSNNILKFSVQDFELRNDEIIGITMTQLFISNLQLIPLKVDCLINANQYIDEFQLIYNVSHNASIIERHHMSFTVDLLDIYIYKNQSPAAIIATTLLVCIILVVGIFYLEIGILMIQWYRKLRVQEQSLSETLSKYMTLPTSGRANTQTNTQTNTRPLSPTGTHLIASNFTQQQQQQ